MPFILLMTFFSLAIVLRIAIQYYYTGNHGVRFAARSAPLLEIIPGTIFILSFIVSALFIILHHLGLFAFHNTPSTLMQVLAGGIGFSGIIITVIAQIQMGRSWRIGVDQGETTQLITSGLYAKSRNPIYFGILLYWIGIVMSTQHLLLWVCAILCWLSIEVIVRKIEEPYLQNTHGTAFERYKTNTHRYLPL